ncbi:DUF6800 family protein [Alienimonas sp. DA493]|uniref:DUF6800 family protein n=1 Tax=Alienimonas sp. DA493 TaxID=3373605 RepID=UPI0037547386
MPKPERQKELARRRHRKIKLKKLRVKYTAANSAEEKDEIFAKARRISPFVARETFDEPFTRVSA